MQLHELRAKVKALKDSGWSLKYLAMRSGICHHTVKDFITGRTIPQIATVLEFERLVTKVQPKEKDE